jgi:hypothetical protein
MNWQRMRTVILPDAGGSGLKLALILRTAHGPSTEDYEAFGCAVGLRRVFEEGSHG